MSAHRRPRSTAAAATLCERYAALAGEAEAIEATRNAAIAAANAAADEALTPVTAEMDDIRAKLAPWWAENAAGLTGGKRKGIELGGCAIGTRESRANLVIGLGEDKTVELMRAARWAKPLIRIKYSIDRAATLKAIDGPNMMKLREIGVHRDEGGAQFFVKRAEQAGTIAPKR